MIACDPKATFWLSLRGDSDMPEDKRPAFQCRFLSVRKAHQLSAARDSVVGKSYRDAEPILLGALRAVVIDGRNLVDEDGQPMAFSADALAALTFDEIIELVHRIPLESEASEIDLKKSASPAPSQPESSAPTAPGAVATNAATPASPQS